MGPSSPVSRSGPVAYVLLTFAISWSFFGVWLALADPAPLVQTLLLAGGGLGPFAAALVLVCTRADWTLRSWLRSRFRVRLPARVYLFALLLPPVGVALAGAIHQGAFGAVASPDPIPPLVEYPIFFGFVLLVGGGTEEPGWRGYLLPLLQERWTPLNAALVIGVAWFAWHLPLLFVEGTVQSTVPVWLYGLQLVALSIVLTWLTNVAEGAVLPAMFLHAGANIGVTFYPAGGAAGGTSDLGFGVIVGVLVVVAGGIVLASGPALGRRAAWERRSSAGT